MSKVLVFGGCGALGRSAVKAFQDAGHHVISIDFSASETASRSIVLKPGAWGDHLAQIERETEAENINVVFCAAGGWAGGSIKSDDLVANIDKMISMNVHSALQASRIAGESSCNNSK